MSARLRGYMTFANVVSCLALFIALGGASYATLRLPRNSVGTAQIRKAAVTQTKIAPAAQKALKGQTGLPGPAGPQGAAGAPATALWAVLREDGSIARQSGAVTSANLDTEGGTTFKYYVRWNRDVSKCAYVAADYNDGQVPMGQNRIAYYDTVFQAVGDPTAIVVSPQTNGLYRKSALTVTVFC